MSIYAAQVVNALPGIESKTYLELGLDDDKRTFGTFEKVIAGTKYGVDIEVREFQTHHMTTDEFFTTHAPALAPFDVVFIDADHHHEPVIADYNNACKFLAPNGIILAHDLVPPDENFCKRDSCSTGYYLLNALMERGDQHLTLDHDCGLTVFPHPKPIERAAVHSQDFVTFCIAIHPSKVTIDALMEKVKGLWPTVPPSTS